jgi:hypothetical protein
MQALAGHGNLKVMVVKKRPLAGVGQGTRNCQV